MAYFAASVDTPEDNKKFAESLGLDFPILSDPGKQVATAYGVVTPERQFAQRWTFYIGVDGKILYIDKKCQHGDGRPGPCRETRRTGYREEEVARAGGVVARAVARTGHRSTAKPGRPERPDRTRIRGRWARALWRLPAEPDPPVARSGRAPVRHVR